MAAKKAGLTKGRLSPEHAANLKKALESLYVGAPGFSAMKDKAIADRMGTTQAGPATVCCADPGAIGCRHCTHQTSGPHPCCMPKRRPAARPDGQKPDEKIDP